MSPDTASAAPDRPRGPGGAAPLGVGAAAVAASAAVIALAAPLRGGVLTTALVTLLLLCVPGYLALGLLRLQGRLHSLPALVAMCTGLGTGVIVPFAGLALAQGWALDGAARALVGLEVVALLVWSGLARARGCDGFVGLRGRSPAEWLADASVLATGAALGTFYVTTLEPAMRSGDLWYYLSYIDWMANEPGREYIPHSTDPEEWSGRLIASGFLAFEAMITALVRVDAGSLEVFWSWLPATLLPLALVALYGLACSLGAGAWTRIALVAFQLVLVFATLGYLTDRETSGVRWPGSVLFFRISQDKVYLAYILAPVAAMLGVEWMRRREWRWLAALLLVGAGCVVTHPLGLPFVAMMTLPYAVVTALLAGGGEPLARRLRAVAALALAIAPLVAWPLSQRAEEGAPNTLADEAGFQRRAHLTVDSLSIESRERNEFTAHPSLVSHPLLLAGIACGLVLALASRERADARYAFAATLAPMAMLYVPGIPPLAGAIVTPYLLWRFTWLLPVALSLAVATTLVGAIAARWLGERARVAGALAFVLAAGGAASVPRDLARARETVDALLPAPFDSTTARRLVGGIRETVPEGERILLDPALQTLAISLAPGMQTVYWRMGSNPQLYWDVIDLFESRFLSRRHFELLREHDVDWIGVRRRSALLGDVQRRSDLFVPAGTVASIHLFRIDAHALARSASASDDRITQQRRIAAREPSAANLTLLGLALLGEGHDAEANEVLERALALDADYAPAHEWKGTLALVARDYASAVAHLERAVELDPELATAGNNLAWLLATCPDDAIRDPARALVVATATIERTGINGGALDTLATAQAANGAFADAMRSTRQALDIYESVGASAERSEPLRARLALYAQRRPYIDTPAEP